MKVTEATKAMLAWSKCNGFVVMNEVLSNGSVYFSGCCDVTVFRWKLAYVLRKLTFLVFLLFPC